MKYDLKINVKLSLDMHRAQLYFEKISLKNDYFWLADYCQWVFLDKKFGIFFFFFG
jgi:hypothetical protein